MLLMALAQVNSLEGENYDIPEVGHTYLCELNFFTI